VAQPLAALDHAFTQEAVDQLEQLHPLAQTASEVAQRLGLGEDLFSGQTRRQQLARFVTTHRIDWLSERIGGKHVTEPRRDQPRGVGPAL
jgi:hypothetical protein